MKPGIPSEPYKYSATFVALVLGLWPFIAFAVNVPVWDEYEDILGFLNFYKTHGFYAAVTTFGAKISGYNLHLIEFISWVGYSIFGSVNFKILTGIGVILQALCFSILAQHTMKGFKTIAILFFGLLFFQFCYWEMTFFSLVSIENYKTLLGIILISLFALSEKRNDYWSLIGSMLFSFLLIYSSFGNEITLVPIVGYIFLTRKKYKLLAGWIVFSLLMAALYYLAFSVEGKGDVTPFSEPILYTIKYFIYLLSGAFGIRTGWAGLFLLALVLYAFYLNYRNASKASVLMNSLLVFSFVTQMMIASGRASQGLDSALLSRYSFFAALEIMIVCLTFYHHLKTRELIKNSVLGVFAIGIYGYSYIIGVSALSNWQQVNDSILTSYQTKEQTEMNVRFSGSCCLEYSTFLNEAINNEIYAIPDRLHLAKPYHTPDSQ